MTFTKSLSDSMPNSGSGSSLSIPVTGRVFATAFSKGNHFGNNPMLALGMRSSVIIFLTNFHEEEEKLDKVDVQVWREVNHDARVQCLDWPYPPSPMLPLTDLMALATGGADGKVRVFRLRTSSEENDEVQNIHSHSDYVNSVAFKPDGNVFLASGSDDCSVIISNLETGQRHAVTFCSPVMTVAWHVAEESKLMAAEKKGLIHIFNTVTNRPIMSFDAACGPLMAADWCLKNSLYILAAVRSEIFIWDTSAPSKPVFKTSIHEESVRYAQFSKVSENLVATSGQPNYSVKVLNAKSCQVIYSNTEGPVGGISWHPKLNCLAIGRDESVMLYFPR